MTQVTEKCFVGSLNIFVGQYVLIKYVYTLKNFIQLNVLKIT